MSDLTQITILARAYFKARGAHRESIKNNDWPDDGSEEYIRSRILRERAVSASVKAGQAFRDACEAFFAALIKVEDAREQSGDDRCAGVELTQWGVGRVLNEEDVQFLQEFLREVDDDAAQNVDVFHQARETAFEEIGGQDLVDAMRSQDAHQVERATQRALKMFYERLANQRAEAH